MNNGSKIPDWVFVVGVWVIIIAGVVVFLTRQTLWQWLTTGAEFEATQKYLLSATAQVLAALFALVFSITLIATQFVTKYTHRTMQIIFNKWVIGYMILFAGSIIVPLACLSNPSGLGSFISFAYGSVMIILLIPFFLDLKRRMNIGWIITCLKEEGLKAVGNTKLTEEKREGKTKENINALDNIGMGAFTDRNFEVFELAEKALAEFALGIENNTEDLEVDTEDRKLYFQIFENLLKTCEEVIDNPRTPKLLIKHLDEIVKRAIEDANWTTVERIAYLLGEVSELSLDESAEPFSNSRRDLSKTCSESIHKITMDMPFKDLSIMRFFRLALFLVITEIKIYKRWFKIKWHKLTSPSIYSPIELINKFLPWIENFRTLVRHLFPYLEKAIAIDFSHTALMIRDCFAKITPVLDDKGIPEGFTQFFVSELNKYAEKLLPEENQWHEVGEWMLEEINSIADLALKHNRYELFRTAQIFYLGEVCSNPLSDEIFLKLYAAFLTQIRKLPDLPNEYWEKMWVFFVANAMNLGTQRLMKQNETELIKTLWKEIIFVSNKIISVALNKSEKEWVDALVNLHDLFLQIMYRNHEKEKGGFLNQNEVFNRVWLTYATFRPPTTGFDPLGNYLLQNKEIAKDFFSQYEVAKEEGVKLGIPEDVFEERRGFLKMTSQYSE